ncbi:MAG: GIY-YIG nuclease family protein [Armatimonadota bacterium]
MKDSKLDFELTRHATSNNILYAFICDGQVKYIGKTIRTLSARMYGYKNPGPTQITNINNNKRINDLLSEGIAVGILALPDNGLMHIGQFHLNLAAGLEDDIIRVINPEWNGGMPEDLRISSASTSTDLSEPRRSPLQTFNFNLAKTYLNMGFFNVSVAFEKGFGADGETIELILGSASQPILGTINRRVNMNGTPRIMGGTGLRNWFQANAKIDGNIVVDVLSPTSIRLRVDED